MKVPALVRRAGWNLGEQMISSLTNSVLSILVANSVSADSFGGFAIAFTVFALAVGGVRAVSTSPLNIRFADASPAEAKRVAGASAGNALMLGIVIGAGCAAAGLFLPGALGESLLALGVIMPALLVQDTYRYVFFARGEPAKAAMTSGLWAVLQIGAVTALLVAGTEAVGTLLLAWGISAAAAALLAVKQSGAWPAPRAAWSWIKEHRDLTGYKLATFVTAQGTTQGAILVIAAVATLATVGSLRGTQVLLGPTSILALATLNFALPELARRRSRMTERTWLYAALGVSGFVGLAGLVWGSIFLLAPDALGEFILDASWPGTSAILFAAVITQVLSGLSIGPVTVIYAIDRASATLVIQIILGALTFVGGVGGVLLGGAIGAQWGFAVANAIVVPCWYFQMWRQLKWVAENRPAEVADGPEDTTVLAARPPQHDAFFDDMSTMSTMLLPRIEPRSPQPTRAPAGPPRPTASHAPPPPALQPPRGQQHPSGAQPPPRSPQAPFGPQPPHGPQRAPHGVPVAGPPAGRPGPRPGPGLPPAGPPPGGANPPGPLQPGSLQPGTPRPGSNPPQAVPGRAPRPATPVPPNRPHPPGPGPLPPYPPAGPRPVPPPGRVLPPSAPRGDSTRTTGDSTRPTGDGTRPTGDGTRPTGDGATAGPGGNGRPQPHPSGPPGRPSPEPRPGVPPVSDRPASDAPRPRPTPRPRAAEAGPGGGRAAGDAAQATTALPSTGAPNGRGPAGAEPGRATPSRESAADDSHTDDSHPGDNHPDDNHPDDSPDGSGNPAAGGPEPATSGENGHGPADPSAEATQAHPAREPRRDAGDRPAADRLRP